MDTKASIKATIKSIKEEVVDEKSSFEKCHVCNETFDKFSLEVHNLACKKEIACQFCDKTFSKKGHLTYHVRGAASLVPGVHRHPQFSEHCHIKMQ